ncbi:MAG: hypothetical protein HYX68_00040 [Planctomycetes bacterium]|nr:hypothetical protein [Planctomycetota bacterium]
MSRAKRIKLIESIEKERGSKLITYLTSTRKGWGVQMGMDAVRRIYDHLEIPSDSENVDLLLHSHGGEGIVPWRLATLIRERAKKFSVLVPFKAFSAATLTALGADEVVMHPMGMLGPTDATVTNAFNPVDPTNPQARLGISVEDVTAYIALIKEDAGIQHEDELVKAFNRLTKQVHPLALGNVKRSLSQSRMMAKKLLSLHMPKEKSHQIDEIVDHLTSKLYFHGHPINRQEARDHVGLATVIDPPQRVEKLMWRLYLDYEEEMKLEEPFDIISQFLAEHPSLVAGASKITNPQKSRLVCIESKSRADYYEVEYELYGEKPPTGPGIAATVVRRNERWTTETGEPKEPKKTKESNESDEAKN